MPLALCVICTKTFYAKPSHLTKGWGKYCSVKCRTRGQFTGKKIKCFICKKEVYKQLREFRRSKSGNFFCGKRCQTIWRNKFLFSGQNHFNWTNGQFAYRQILKRTEREQKCLLCDSVDARVLAVHHIDKNRKNNKVENLTWLCHNCHYLVHHFNNEQEKLSVKLAQMVAVAQK